ncbi:hypothetical protein K431DRAFT_344586 [Polychaeton citri CBS 116435]|uniref:Uncharacterized protein n=1 Tax=Polychaeton citri CBS 116435 TaxID=1314669 RepID=A0A9P4QAN6_9PEZI|nr:hypothetical protein K431DRAFT_344586 [Polychaeton citri CBS 116435]
MTGRQISLPRLCLDIIDLVTHLQDLDVSSDYFRYPEFCAGLRERVNKGGLQSLQSSSLCLDLPRLDPSGIDAVQYWEDALLTPFLATNIKFIAAVMTLSPQIVSQLHISSLTRLVLHHSQAGHFDLSGLLTTTPSLFYLEYHALVDYGWLNEAHWSKQNPRPSYGLEALLDALHHVSDTLKELVTSQIIYEDCPRFHTSYGADYELPFRVHEEMSKLEHLHALSIPYASLLGWRCKPDQDWVWRNILPPSLRQINLTDDPTENILIDRWTDESLMPVFSGLLA